MSSPVPPKSQSLPSHVRRPTCRRRQATGERVVALEPARARSATARGRRVIVSLPWPPVMFSMSEETLSRREPLSSSLEPSLATPSGVMVMSGEVVVVGAERGRVGERVKPSPLLAPSEMSSAPKPPASVSSPTESRRASRRPSLRSGCRSRQLPDERVVEGCPVGLLDIADVVAAGAVVVLRRCRRRLRPRA